jgi:hypothetical protein
MPPAEPTLSILSPGADGCTPEETLRKRDTDRLFAVQLAASAIFSIESLAMALWNDDRSHCILGRLTGQLLGFPENELWASKERWLGRIDPRDRKRVSRLWQGVNADIREQVCRYVFWPLNGSPAILLEESAYRLIAAPDNESVFLCHYHARSLGSSKSRRNPDNRSPMRNLIHQIGNNLQAVRGEVELLRLFGELPQKSFENIMRGINSIHDLTAQLDPPSAENGSGVFGGHEDVPTHGGKKGRRKGVKGV